LKMVLYLVDDEKKTRDSMMEFVPWAEIGITKIIPAKNGVEALEHMQEDVPDIILSDIMMPKMDGISFAEEVRNMYPDCIIIFLSGYADKDNLKSAISLEAFQFIEKPVEIDVLIQTVRHAVERINVQNQKKNHVNNLEKIYAGSQVLLNEQLLRMLCSSEQLSDSVSGLLENHPFILSKVLKLYCVKLIKHKSSSCTQSEIQKVTYSVLTKKDYPDHMISGFVTDTTLVMLIEDDLSESLISPILTELCKCVDSLCDYTVSVSPPFRNIQNVFSVFKLASEQTEVSYYYETGQCVRPYSSAGSSYIFPQELYQSFSSALSGNDREASENALLNIKNRILNDKPAIMNAKDVLRTSATCIHNEAVLEALVSGSNANEFQSDLKELSDSEHFSDAMAILSDMTNAFLDSKWQIMEYDNRIRNIIQYIQQNIGNSQLSIADIADHFSMSEAYLSSCFKTATHRTLHQYILHARLEKAKKMLRSTNEKVSVIGCSVGFTDTNYFSDWFRQQTSLSPLNYRKGNGHEKEI
jgi:two-component system response regulator YesN